MRDICEILPNLFNPFHPLDTNKPCGLKIRTMAINSILTARERSGTKYAMNEPDKPTNIAANNEPEKLPIPPITTTLNAKIAYSIPISA